MVELETDIWPAFISPQSRVKHPFHCSADEDWDLMSLSKLPRDFPGDASGKEPPNAGV